MLCNQTPDQQGAIYQRRRTLESVRRMGECSCFAREVKGHWQNGCPRLEEVYNVLRRGEGYSSWSAIRNDGLTIKSIHTVRRVKERDHFNQKLIKLARLQRELSNAV